jgi:hypothetical protein
MPLVASLGFSQAINPRQAGEEASKLALHNLGSISASLGIILASEKYNAESVIEGVTQCWGNTPLFGFSTTAELIDECQRRHSVVTCLIGGSDWKVISEYLPAEIEDLQFTDTPDYLGKLQNILSMSEEGFLLLAGDGLSSSFYQVVEQLNRLFHNKRLSSTIRVAGSLAGAHVEKTHTDQIGGRQVGKHGIAAAYVTGDIAIGIGAAHGWSAIGPYVKVTSVDKATITGLDDRPPTQVYAQLLGTEPTDWTTTPLNELVRLYPLSIDPDRSVDVDSFTNLVNPLIRSAVRVENDGSLRLNHPINQGQFVHLMAASQKTCLEAAANATKQAVLEMKQAGGLQPALALLQIDEAWRLLFDSDPGAVQQAVKAVVGENVPLIGGYTLGQIARQKGQVKLLNQHILVVLVADKL